MSDTASQPSFGVTDVLLFTMAVIWGVNFIVVKYATTIFDPVAFTALRVGAAAVFLLVVALFGGKPALARRDTIRLLLLGLIGNGLYQAFFVHGVARTRAGNAALIIGAAPGFIALIARMRGMERVSRLTLVGIALSIIGVAVVMLGSAEAATGSPTILGSLLVFCGVLCWSAFTIGLQPYTTRIDVVQLSATTMTGGAVPLLLTSVPSLVSMNWSRIGMGGWLALLYSSVVSLGIAYFFWYRGLRILGPTRAAVYSNLQPIIALLSAWAFLSETPTWFQGVGAATIVAGVFLTRA